MNDINFPEKSAKMSYVKEFLKINLKVCQIDNQVLKNENTHPKDVLKTSSYLEKFLIKIYFFWFLTFWGSPINHWGHQKVNFGGHQSHPWGHQKLNFGGHQSTPWGHQKKVGVTNGCHQKKTCFEVNYFGEFLIFCNDFWCKLKLRIHIFEIKSFYLTQNFFTSFFVNGVCTIKS